MMGGACGLDLTTRTTSCWGSTFMNPDNEGISVLVDGGESAIDLIGASMIGMIHADGGRIRVIGEFLYGHVWNLSTRKFSEYPIRPLVNRMITDDASYWCAELQGGATVCTPDMGLPLGIPVPD